MRHTKFRWHWGAKLTVGRGSSGPKWRISIAIAAQSSQRNDCAVSAPGSGLRYLPPGHQANDMVVRQRRRGSRATACVSGAPLPDFASLNAAYGLVSRRNARSEAQSAAPAVGGGHAGAAVGPRLARTVRLILLSQYFDEVVEIIGFFKKRLIFEKPCNFN
jgi:hypothetical protein